MVAQNRSRLTRASSGVVAVIVRHQRPHMNFTPHSTAPFRHHKLVCGVDSRGQDPLHRTTADGRQAWSNAGDAHPPAHQRR